MKFTNTQKGARGVNTVAGLVIIEPGQSIDADISEAELKSAKATGWFEIGGKAEAPADDLDRDALKKDADDLGIEYAKNITTEKLKELVDAKLAENAK